MVKTTATFDSIYLIITITIYEKSFFSPHILVGMDAL